MSVIELKEPWSLTYSRPSDGKRTTIKAQVPGNVIGDLFRAGGIPDPYFGNNSDLLRPYEFIDWEYRTMFRTPSLAKGERLWLVMAGVDTVSEIFVNGQSVGHTDNMVTPYRFELAAERLDPENNELMICIQSSVNYARQFAYPPYCQANAYEFEGLYLRRPMHTYGWDIAPRLVGAGIWRPAYLEVQPSEHWGDLYLATTEISAKISKLSLSWHFETGQKALTGYEALLVMSCRDQKIEKRFPLYFTAGTLNFELADAYLWSPIGSGEPHLYDVTLELLHEGRAVDTKSWKTGVRTIELLRSDKLTPEKPGEFVFIVNGRRTFIKGANWVPSDALHGEKPERVRKNLELFVDLGCNMVRCWGGNAYESEDFFDFCDEHGLLVWQDFMFACETAPQDDAFIKSVRREAEILVKACRNHPSLALWCGDNECDELFFYSPLLRKLMPSVNRVSREVLPKTVMYFDPVRDYLPSSPFRSDAFKRHELNACAPEEHLWGPRDTWKSNYYKDNTAIFASEVGYHGMTDVESVKRFIPEAELNDRCGASWLCHAAQPFGDRAGAHSYRNKLMEDQAKNFWGYAANDLCEFMKCSQIVQAEAMKYMIELFRAKKWTKTGLIWWNVIDCWPQFSDAVTDYYYVKKLAYYYIKNAQQPLSLIVSDPEAWCCRLTAANDSPAQSSGKYRVTDIMTGELFAEGEYAVAAESATEVDSFKVCQSEHRMFLIEWDNHGKKSYNHYLMGDAPFSLERYLECLKKLDETIYYSFGRHEW